MTSNKVEVSMGDFFDEGCLGYIVTKNELETDDPVMLTSRIVMSAISNDSGEYIMFDLLDNDDNLLASTVIDRFVVDNLMSVTEKKS